MAGVRKTADLSQSLARVRLSDMVAAPNAKDIKDMFEKCREMPGSVIEWTWRQEPRTYLLTAKFPYFRDRDWWDYELRDDPDWCLSDDRAQGNNIIWEYKTSDLELVIEIVQMQEANARKAAAKAARGEEEEAEAEEQAAVTPAASYFKMDDQANQMFSAQTGLYKYETILTFLKHEYRLFKEKGIPLSLIVFEIRPRSKDGTETMWLSPETVAEITEKVMQIKRPLDVFGHFQLLDFALVMPNTDIKEATTMAERLSNFLVQNIFSDGTDGKVKLISSCGLGGLPHQGNRLQGLIKAAMKAKDEAKAGNWLMVMAPPGEPPEPPPPPDSEIPHSHSHMASSAVLQLIDRPSPEPPPISARRKNHSPEDLKCRDLLIRASLISPENFETVLNLSEKMHMPVARVLSIEGHMQEPVVKAAYQVQEMVSSGQLTVEQAVKALKLLANHNLDLDTAIKRLGLVDASVKKHALASLLRAAGIVRRSVLESNLRDAATVGLPLGFVLASRGLLAPPVRHASITLLRLMRDASLSREKAVEALKTVHAGTSSMSRFLRDNSVDLPEPAAGLGELLARSGVTSDTDMMIAREIELVNKKELGQALIDSGFVDAAVVALAKDLASRIESGEVEKGLAIEILERNAGDAEGADVPALIAEAKAHEAAIAAQEAEAAARAAAPAVIPEHERTQDESNPEGIAAVNDDDSAEFRHVEEHEDTQSSHPMLRPRSPDEPSGQQKSVDPKAAPPASANVARPPQLPYSSPAQSFPPQKPSPPPAPPKVEDPKAVDRVELLKRAAYIDDKQIKVAASVATATKTSLMRALFDTGAIDQPVLNLAASAKRHLDAGDVDVATAVRILSYCKNKKSTNFDDAMEIVTSRSL